MIGIYKITNPIGNIYVGQTKNFLQRLEDHKSRKNKKANRLNESIIKYGLKNHTITFIEECLEEDLNCRERYWQDFYDVLGENGLNSILTKCGELKGLFLESLKQDMSDRQQGENNSFYGKKHTEEAKEKIRLANLRENNHNYGRKLTDEEKDNIRKHRLLFKHSKETIEKLKLLSSGGNNPRAKKVINTDTLQVWSCIKDCANDLEMKYSTLFNQLKGKYTNKTKIVYLNDYENTF
jgi:group I intron endonuclease